MNFVSVTLPSVYLRVLGFHLNSNMQSIDLVGTFTFVCHKRYEIMRLTGEVVG